MVQSRVGTAMLDNALDINVVKNLRAEVGDDPEIINELIDLYLEDGPPLIATLHDAVQNHDVATIGRVAHRLKGSSASLGAIVLSQICRDLEQENAMADVEAIVVRLEAEYQRVEQALNLERLPSV